MSQEKQKFVERLIEVVSLLQYPEHGRQTQLAQRYKIKQPSVGKWFKGESMPNYEIALDLCKRALISYEWLMTGRGEKFFVPGGLDRDIEQAVRIMQAMEPNMRSTAVKVLAAVAEPPTYLPKPGDGTNGH